MDTASGVYLHIKDSSFQTSGASSLMIIIPMLTTKGKIGINDVDATTFKDIVGYDMSYNSNYYGLNRILEKVSHAYVWRINQNAKLANAYFVDSTSEKEYNPDAQTFEDITKMDPHPLLAIAHKDVGDFETAGVKFKPTPDVTTIVNENATLGTPQVIVLEDINPKELTTIFNKEVLASCIFYNSSNNAIVGTIKKDAMENIWKPYRVIDGEIVDDIIKTVVTNTNTWSDGTNFFDATGIPMTEPEGDVESTVEIGTVRSYNSKFYEKKIDDWYEVVRFTESSILTQEFRVEDTDVISALEAASDLTISYELYRLETKTKLKDNSIGTVDFDEENAKLTITLTKKFSSDTYWMTHVIPVNIKNWTMVYGVYDGRNYNVKSEIPFSFDIEAENYIENVDFGEIQIYTSNTFPSTWEKIRDYIILEGGTNGDKELNAIDVDTAAIDDVNANVLLFNGMTDISIVNRICNKAVTKKIHCFVDVPAFASYVDAYEWSRKVLQSQYVALGARPDQAETADGKIFYIYPSVNYGAILANMIDTYGSLNYPPAGATYGNITAENLLKCDYPNFANEMKTYRMNWQISDANGTVMWEQRTTYNLNSDLSYIAPTFIVDDLAERIVSFERMFNFRYASRTDLLNQESGLTSILNDFQEKGFISRFELVVPSYTEAQKAGRTLTIKIGVAIAKDTEVIYLEVELLSA